MNVKKIMVPFGVYGPTTTMVENIVTEFIINKIYFT